MKYLAISFAFAVVAAHAQTLTPEQYQRVMGLRAMGSNELAQASTPRFVDPPTVATVYYWQDQQTGSWYGESITNGVKYRFRASFSPWNKATNDVQQAAAATLALTRLSAMYSTVQATNAVLEYTTNTVGVLRNRWLAVVKPSTSAGTNDVDMLVGTLINHAYNLRYGLQ